MDVLRAILLGIIEGFTEFLPVSSTGHLVLAMPWLGISAEHQPWKALLWVSQFGAILAVVVYFWRDLWRRTFTPPSTDWRAHILTKLFVAMVPTVVLAVLLKEKYFDPLETNEVAVAGALIVGAGLMWWIDRRFRRERPMTLEDVTLMQAALIGMIQCISMWPGVSRSGASILGGMALGLTPAVAAEFSFYLAIPTMLGAALKKLWEARNELNADIGLLLLVGTATAFVVALLCVAWFMPYVRRRRFTAFVVYRVILGTAVLAYVWLGQ